VCNTDDFHPSPSLMISINPNLHDFFTHLNSICHPLLGLLSCFFLCSTPTKVLCTPFFSHMCFMFNLSRSHLLSHPNNDGWRSQFISISLCNFLHLQTYFKDTVLSNIFSQCSSYRMKHHIPFPLRQNAM
jgi:hypothetical protein